MALTVLSTNIGVPTPISTSIVSDTDDFATVIQLAGVVCATTASGIVTGAYANVAVNGTIFANGTFSAGVQTDDHSLVDIGATGLVIGGDRGIQTGPWSTISVAGTVSGREFGIMTDFSSAITVEATGTVPAGRAGLDGTALRVGSDSSVKIDGMVFAGGAGILLESSRTAVSVTGQVSSDDVAIDGLQSGSNSIAVSGLVSGKNVGVGLGFAASLDVAAGGVVSCAA